jgi:hypothetical protein
VVPDPDEVARERMDRKREQLQAKGYPNRAAAGAVEWAMGLARRRVPPECDTVRFLAELDRRLAQCENWARETLRFVNSSR